MNGKKMRGRASARRASWDATKQRPGSKRPGSMKKNWPHGQGKSHKK